MQAWHADAQRGRNRKTGVMHHGRLLWMGEPSSLFSQGLNHLLTPIADERASLDRFKGLWPDALHMRPQRGAAITYKAPNLRPEGFQ